MTLRLSICIPTHHGRCGTLREALDSILPQITPQLRGRVEVCINDNASEDGTEALVEECSRQYPGVIRYHRNPENLGFTRNVANSVALAQGDYCWFCSSDDQIASEGIERALKALTQYPAAAGITVDFRSYDRHMQQVVGVSHPLTLLPEHPEQEQAFTSPAQIFRACGSVQGNFSMQIFDRRLWLEVVQEIGAAKATSFRYFAYLYVFGRMVKKRPVWVWLPEKLIKSRSQNDYLSGELGHNMLRYHTSTMLEASQVWGELFGRSSATYQSLMYDNYRIFWSAWPVIVYKGKHLCTSKDEINALAAFTRRLFFLPSFWTACLPALLVPRLVPRSGLLLLRRLGLEQFLQDAKKRLLRLRSVPEQMNLL